MVLVECLKGFEISYFKDSKECDFILKKENKIEYIIQVTYQLNKFDTRELSGLLNALEYYDFNSGIILINSNK